MRIQLIFIIILLMFIFNVSAINVTHINKTIIAPGEYVFNSTCVNLTSVYNITCIDTDPKCEITRSLNFGEYYIRRDDKCNIEFSCPDANESYNHKSYKIRWRLKTENNTINITYMNENKSRSYPITEKFDIEDEFNISCPEYENQRQLPINLSSDQWNMYCLSLFSEYGKSLVDVTTDYSTLIVKVAEDVAKVSQTNEGLAKENGQLKIQIVDYNKCEAENVKLNNELDEANDKIKEYHEDLLKCLNDKTNALSSSKSNKNLFIIFAVLFAVVIYFIGFTIFLKRLY